MAQGMDPPRRGRRGRGEPVNLLLLRIRRRRKRRRFARACRNAEASAFTCQAIPGWSRIRRLNDVSHVWERNPDGPRHR